MSEQTEALAYTMVDNSLTVILPNGDTKTVNKSDDPNIFEQVLAAIVEENWGEIPDIICPKARLASFSEEHIKIVDGAIHINGRKVPRELSDRIMDYASQNIPYQPLLKFWDNLNENPSNRVLTRLYDFLEKNRHPITPDGCFIGYRGVGRDFKDQHTHTMDNSPGEILTMNRNEVDETDAACSAGLHVASYEFGSTFGPITIMVKVNPKDVVSIPSSYDTDKMRVCRFEVLQQVNKGSTESLHDDGSELQGPPSPQIPMAEEDDPEQLNESDDDDDDDDESNDEGGEDEGYNYGP